MRGPKRNSKFLTYFGITSDICRGCPGQDLPSRRKDENSILSGCLVRLPLDQRRTGAAPKRTGPASSVERAQALPRSLEGM